MLIVERGQVDMSENAHTAPHPQQPHTHTLRGKERKSRDKEERERKTDTVKNTTNFDNATQVNWQNFA